MRKEDLAGCVTDSCEKKGRCLRASKRHLLHKDPLHGVFFTPEKTGDECEQFIDLKESK